MRSACLSATGRVPFGVAALLLVPLLTCSCNDEPGSVTTVVFDGTTQTITGHVACTSQPDGKLVILVNEDGGKKTIRVLLSARGRLVVEKAALRYLDHSGYVADPREVVATKVDDTYKFSGRMPPNAGESQWHLFEIEATCPFVKDAPPPRLDAPIGAP
ncbi:MAG TPA: lipoprotein LpqH [Mycobacterium sp.]